MIALAIAALLVTSPVQDPSPQTQPQAAEPAPATDLGDIDVVGRPLDTMINTFVNEVAAPNRHRGIARWDRDICIGVANLRPDTAQFLVDRVSAVAEDVGLNPGLPGCKPTVIIIASDDPDGLAATLTHQQRRAFRRGGSGMDRGRTALQRTFVASDRPVRWWQVSMPVDSETGQRAIRIPGECLSPCMNPEDYAPTIAVFAASNLSTQIVDNLTRAIIILDIDQVGQVSGQQLADYIAMITLAQIDPEADTRSYASILNVFEDPDAAPGLTNWDMAYLNGLYDAQRTRKNLRAGRSEIASSIHRVHQTLAAAEE